MRDARTWIARLGTAGLCLVWIGCGGGGVPDPGSDPTAVVEAPPPPVSGVAPSTVSSAPAPAAAEVAAPEPAPAAGQIAAAAPPVAAPPVAAPPIASAPAQAPAEPVAVVAAPAAPADGSPAPAEEKPQAAAKGDASATSELLNLSSSTTNAAPAAEAAKGDVPVASVPGGPGNVGGPGGAMPGGGPGGFGPNRGGPGMPGGPGGQGGMPGMPGDGGTDANAPANYTTPMYGAVTFLNAVKSKNKDRIADATALHAQNEAHNVALQKLFTQIVDLSVSDEQIDELAKALNGYVISGVDMATSSGRQKVVLGKSNGANGQFRRTLTMRREAKGWKVGDISGQSEIQGMGIPGVRRRTGTR